MFHATFRVFWAASGAPPGWEWEQREKREWAKRFQLLPRAALLLFSAFGVCIRFNLKKGFSDQQKGLETTDLTPMASCSLRNKLQPRAGMICPCLPSSCIMQSVMASVHWPSFSSSSNPASFHLPDWWRESFFLIPLPDCPFAMGSVGFMFSYSIVELKEEWIKQETHSIGSPGLIWHLQSVIWVFMFLLCHPLHTPFIFKISSQSKIAIGTSAIIGH